ncbi:response regulator transcription factor [Catenuloplanes atrovinosus]|uniref:DNA-binding response OmpR family regulator n=1 Tax=Catenuloplanes atrovinosus TaxID=137266 RepID=A0AAE3YNP5_9ACTN|nr:response regulator transcription factor [Catenuloplanes atrovinosus]MDR7277178.1 DNA-binding response OmpR family regulator [Catenuloplanes atrovinosus]
MGSYVLVAEDDERQAEVLRQYLEADGHRAVVVHDGQAALDHALRHPPDLIVLDVMLPLVSGLQVCRRLRQESSVPVLMLTARTEEEDQLVGLELGADDYLTKPYSPRVLMARIRGLLRRAATGPDTTGVRRIGPLTVDPGRHEVSVGGRRVECTRAEFAILEAMSAQPDRVFTRNQLLDVASGLDRAATRRAIDVHVLNLRRKIEGDPRRPVLLVTVYGIGYKLTAGA